MCGWVCGRGASSLWCAMLGSATRSAWPAHPSVLKRLRLCHRLPLLPPPWACRHTLEAMRIVGLQQEQVDAGE